MNARRSAATLGLTGVVLFGGMLAPGLAQASDSSGGWKPTSCTSQEKQDWNQQDWQHKNGSKSCEESKQHARDMKAQHDRHVKKQHARDMKKQQNHSNWSTK
jgi:hypothetical protein